MKHLHKYTLLSLILGGSLLSSCNYLDIYPDEDVTEEDMSADRNSAYNFMYSCYGYLPAPMSYTSSLDLYTGDEVATTMMQYNWYYLQSGNFSASNPYISYWNTLYQGIRQCYIFLDKLNNNSLFPGLKDADRADYKAQATFLIGYYHFLLARCYGPIILVKSTPSATTDPEDYLGRSPYDECVDFICQKFDEAAKDLPATRSGDRRAEFGLATSTVALGMKAQMLLYAASPLFNGGAAQLFRNFKNPDGTQLMPLTADASKWTKARDAYKAAIEAAEAAGYHLYTRTDAQQKVNGYPSDGTVRCLRYTITDYTADDEAVGGNPEVLFADARDQSGEPSDWGFQSCCTPFVSGYAYNCVAPTLAMLKRFYTKNGLPIDEDPSFDSDPATMYNPVTIDAAHASEGEEGQLTSKFNLDREPRFYAWIAFQGGYYEIMSPSNNGAYNNDDSYKKHSDSSHGELVCNFMLGGNCSRGDASNPRNADYSLTGYLNKKGCDPDRSQTSNGFAHKKYPWPVLRLADLYLGYAEACVETGDLETARTYINKVRVRAGIPTLEEAWTKAKDPNKPYTQDGLREIVRQERMIELYLENQSFWDLRRWLLAKKYLNVKSEGFSIDSKSMSGFFQVRQLPQDRKFEDHQYLLPIPIADINKNTHVVQNPGY